MTLGITDGGLDTPACCSRSFIRPDRSCSTATPMSAAATPSITVCYALKDPVVQLSVSNK